MYYKVILKDSGYIKTAIVKFDSEGYVKSVTVDGVSYPVDAISILKKI